MPRHDDTRAALAARINGALRTKGLSARRASLQAGLGETFVRDLLQGRVRSPTAENLAALANVLELAASELWPSAASPPSQPLPESNAVFVPDAPPLGPRPVGPIDVPVYGVAEGGQDGAFVINRADGPIDYVARPMSLLRAQNIFAVRIQGNSMAPLWENGDLVYCHPGRGYGPDDFVIVQLEAGPGEPPRALFKQFLRQDNGTLVLRQLNPDTAMTVERARVKNIWPVLHWRELAA